MKIIIFFTIFIFAIVSCKKENTEPKIVSLTLTSINSLVLDNIGNIWVGTDSGLFVNVTSGFKLVDIGFQAAVTSLAYDRSSNLLWVGTDKGLSKLTVKSESTSASPVSINNLSNKSLHSCYIDSAAVRWFSSEIGFTRNKNDMWKKGNFKKNANGTITPLSFESMAINSITSWDGDYFFATYHSIFRAYNWNDSIDAFSGATQMESPYNGLALTDTMYVAFVDSKGQQWFGGRNGLQMHIGHDTKSDNISFYDELVNPIIHCIAEAPDGKLWVGTEGGISIFDGSSWIKKTDGLLNAYITSIVFESSGKAWVGTKKGLVSVNL